MVDIAIGYQHVLALCSDGDVYSWGCGRNGRHGHGHQETLYLPAKIISSLQFKQIYAGFDASFLGKLKIRNQACCLWSFLGFLLKLILNFILKLRENTVVATTEALYAFGSNKQNKLGLNKKKQLFDMITLSNTEVVQKDRPSQVKHVLVGHKIINIAMGREHTVFLTRNGNVFTIGRNSEGQRGLGHCRPCSDITLLPIPRLENRVFLQTLKIAATSFLTAVAIQSRDQENILFCGTRFISKENGEVHNSNRLSDSSNSIR